MTKIRNRFFIFCALVSIASYLAGTAASAAPVLAGKLEATVNKDTIFTTDLVDFKRMLGLRSKVDPFYVTHPIAPKYEKASNEEILEYLIEEQLVIQKFPVQDPEIDQEVQNFQNNLKISKEDLKNLLQREGFSLEEYRSMLKIALAKRQLLDREIRAKAVVSDDDVKSVYFERYGQNKGFRGTVHVFQMSVKKSNYKTPAAAKDFLTDLRKKVLAGESFSETAKSFSEDASQESGGDLGFLAYDEMSETLQKEVKSMKVGDVSAVFDQGSTLSIIRLAEVKTDQDPVFEREKEGLRGQMMQKEFQRQIELWMVRQKNSAYIRKSKSNAQTKTT